MQRALAAVVCATLVLAPAAGHAQHAHEATGSPVQLRFDEVEGAGLVSPQLLLQARAAGVEVIDDATPGGGVSVRIRGGASLMGSEPLYVVDGVPLALAGGISAGGNPLDFIDVTDVETITILKSAAETAAYGIRGGNGVVLIRTRVRGREGLHYSGSLGTSSAPSQPDVLGTAAFREMVAVFDAQTGNDLTSMLGDADTDWREAIQRTPVSHDHTVAWVGAGRNNAFRLSAGYAGVEGVVQRTDAQRATLGIGYTHDLLGDQLHLRASLRGAHADDRFLAPGVLALSAQMAPTQPIRDPASPYGGYFEWDGVLATRNPVAVLELTEDVGTTRRGVAMLEAELELPTSQPLSVTVRYARDAASVERDASQPPELRHQADQFDPGFASSLDASSANTLLHASARHRRTHGALGLDVEVGWSGEDLELEAEYENGQGDPPGSTTRWEYDLTGELRALFANAGVSLADRYFLSLGIRSEGGDDEKFTYPSASVAWVLSEEPFLAGMSDIGRFRLRGSWGRSSTTDIARILFPSTFGIGRTLSTYAFGGDSPFFVFDPELEAEEVTGFDAGLDFQRPRVHASVDVYARTTENLMFRDFGVTNIGTLQNRGFELSLSAMLLQPAVDGIEWSASFVAARNRAEITELDGPAIMTGPIGDFGQFVQVIAEGEAPNAFFVYERRADNPDFDDINDDGFVDARDLFVDRNDDGVINEADLRPHESPAPRWILGHTSRLGWRTLDASFTLRAHIGNHVYDNLAGTRGTLSSIWGGGFPANVHESLNETGLWSALPSSEHYVEDASFLRLETITLGWNPGHGHVRVFGTVRNAFTLTGYRGIDPVVGPDGIDRILYPRARTFIAGANISF